MFSLVNYENVPYLYFESNYQTFLKISTTKSLLQSFMKIQQNSGKLKHFEGQGSAEIKTVFQLSPVVLVFYNILQRLFVGGYLEVL